MFGKNRKSDKQISDLKDLILKLDGRLDELDSRLTKLEGSDFAQNRKRFDSIMDDLRAGTPEVALWE